MQASAPLAQGTYTAQAQQPDAAGNVGFSPADTFTVDTTPPLVSLTSPANNSYTNDVQPSFNGTAGTQPGDQPTVTVDVYSGAGVSGGPVQTLIAQAGQGGAYSVPASAVLAQGTYTTQAQQSDAAGNTGYSPANTFTVDTTPPVVSLTAPADDGYTNNTMPSFSGVAGTQPGDSTSVTIDVYSGASPTGNPAQTVTTQAASDGTYSGQPSSPLADGTYTAQAQQSDAAGNTGYSPANTFTVDTAPPAISVTTPAPGSTDHYRSPTFSGAAGTASGDQPQISVSVYAGPDASSSLVETLAAAASAAQWSAQSSALANGTYTVVAQQTDLAGNTGTASSTFTLDATPPNTTISSGPPSTAESSSASFTFFSSVEGSTFECQLDNAGWSACSSPETYTGLPDGTHTFQVSATDPWGNTDQNPASDTWTIDTSPPHTVITSSPPNPTQSTTATLVFFSTRPGSTFQCQLDGSAWSPCSSPATCTAVGPGEHTFSAQATDPDGLVDPTPASTSWTVGSFLLATDELQIVTGTPGRQRIIAPAVNLQSGIATVATAFCSSRSRQPCGINLQLTAVHLASPPTATTASRSRIPKATRLGALRITVKPGRHITLKLRLTRHARLALAHLEHIRAEATFTLAHGRRINHMISLAVTHHRPSHGG